MNQAQLLAHFERISDAPDAIPCLRRFILDLAVRGKLVEQEPKDESASVLLKRIHAEKARLVKNTSIRKQEPTSQVEIEDQLFELPTNWRWVRFGAIADFQAGRTPSRHDFSFWNTGDYPWISIADMRDGEVVVTTKETISSKAKNQVFRSEPVPAGTLIMSFKLTIGKISRLGIPAFHNEAIISIHPHLPAMDAYLFEVLPQFSRRGDTKDAIKGATLNRDSIANLLLPLPPLSEQERIIAKVDELMALCDRVEAAQAERESRRDRLVASSLNRLDIGAEADAFREHARFYFNHLPRLTTRPEHIQRLRQTILNLAVRGKLVPQDPNEEPASELLKRIQAEQEVLIKGRVLKPDGDDSRLLEEDLPCDLPTNWQWALLRGIIVFGPQNGISPKPSSRPDAPRAITLTATTTGKFNPQHFKRVEATIPPDSEFWLRSGDLLFQRGNTREYVGIAAYYLGEPNLFLYPDLMIKVRLSQNVSLRYVHLWTIAPYARGYFSTHATGAQATMPKINQGILLQLQFQFHHWPNNNASSPKLMS